MASGQAVGEGQRPRGIDVDAALVPGAVVEDPLRDGQRIEELVGDDDGRPRAGRETRVPQRTGTSSPFSVARWTGSSAALLSIELDAQRGAKRRHEARRPQRVAHQRAASGAKLDETQRRRRAHLLPDDGAPQPDDLSEHLADLGRRDEIAAAADGRLASVVAMLGILQARLHVVGNADRSVARDARRELRSQRRRGARRIRPLISGRGCAPGARRTVPAAAWGWSRRCPASAARC